MLNSISGYGKNSLAFGSFKMSDLKQKLEKAKEAGKDGVEIVSDKNKNNRYLVSEIGQEYRFYGGGHEFANQRLNNDKKSVLVDKLTDTCHEYSILG